MRSLFFVQIGIYLFALCSNHNGNIFITRLIAFVEVGSSYCINMTVKYIECD